GGRYGTPLYAASESADVDIVKLLLKGGADPNIEGGEYGTPLQVAVHAGDEEIVKILIQHGADVNTQSGRYGTALYAASHGANFNIVKLLLDNGADPNVGGNILLLINKDAQMRLLGNGAGENTFFLDVRTLMNQTTDLLEYEKPLKLMDNSKGLSYPQWIVT
ncbi:ankyrin repeat-containing domain protein, partial [Mycena epipterygia]